MIAGLQKMTLLDYPGRVACTVFLAGCNYRCPFCHNSQLIGGGGEAMTPEALLQFLSRRKGLLEGVAITGGEPTLDPALPQLLRDIRALGYSVKLDTNGSRPRVLRALLEEGLVDYVAMDIKNCPRLYPATCGREAMDLAPVEQSIRLLMAGSVDYELRTTVVKPLHDAAGIEEMGTWLASLGRAKQIFLQSFVDRETVAVAGLSAANGEEMELFARILRPYVDSVLLRGTP